MSEELEVKVNKRSGSSRSSRSRSSSFRTSSKGAAKTSGAADNSEEESLASSSRSAREKVKVEPSSSHGNATNTSNLSLHHQPNNQNPSQEKTCSSTSLAAGAPTNLGDSSSSLSTRLSLKNLGRKKSPVRTTQFNLPGGESCLSSTATGTDQIPKDSISANTNTSSVVAGVRSATTNSYLSNNLGRSSVDVSCEQTSPRGLLIKKERKGSCSASPPLQRAPHQHSSSPSNAPKASSSALANATEPNTNPTPPPPPLPPPLTATVQTEPADPSIPWIPGTSAPISVDRVHSVKITRKILQNWRSACGRTKDSLIRRWKTLPENHPDFEQCPSSPSTSKKKGCSTSNLNNNNTSSSPATTKKKLDKEKPAKTSGASSTVGGVSAAGGISGPSLGVTTTVATSSSNVSPSKATSVIKNEPITGLPSPKTTARKSPSKVNSSELQSSTFCDSKNTSVIGANSKLSPFSHKRGTEVVENEMPVVGIIGKSSLSGGGGDGTTGNISNTPQGGGGGNTAMRLGASMMSGMGRPSISVANSSGALNGRPGGAQDGGITGPGSSSSSSGPSANAQQKSTGWTVHVWTTYVQRDDLEQDLEMQEPKKPDRDYLSDFQKVKLTHFFRHVLDMNHDDVISAEDFVALNQRIRHYIEWSSECIEFHILKEVHSGFLECFLNQPLDDCSVMYYCNSDRETRQNVNIDEWLDVWGLLLKSARTMESLPLWLQYFPKILFQVINKSGSGTISREELRAFYTMFLGIDFRIVNETLESIHKAMTDGGRHKITYDLFKLCFANFLLGKYPNGPGQYLFGICSPQTLECSFPIDYSALNTDPSDLEPYNPDTDKNQSNRRSVIV